MTTISQAAAVPIRIPKQNKSIVSTICKDGFKQMRSVQQTIFDKLKDAPYGVGHISVSGGKSIISNQIAAHRMRKNKKLLVVIAVPKKNIGKSYVGDSRITQPDGTRIDLTPLDLAHNGGQQKGLEFRAWLSRTHSPQLNDRVIIVTHALLASIREDCPALLNNVLLILDEGHHIKSDHRFNENDLNRLGEIVDFSHAHPANKVQILFMSGTMQRGDEAGIVPMDKAHLYVWAEFDLVEYLTHTEYLEEIIFEFYVTDGPLTDALYPICKALPDDAKVLFSLPAVQSGASGGKYNDRDECYKAWAGRSNAAVNGHNDVVSYVNRRGKQSPIVDVMDDSDMNLRDQRTDYINKAHHSDNPDLLDAIVALGLHKEGSNWRHNNTLVILGQRNSSTDHAQTVGRPMRDCPGKKSVKIIQIIPFRRAGLSNEDVKQDLNNLFFRLMDVLLLQDNMFARADLTKGHTYEGTTTHDVVDHLSELITDPVERTRFVTDVATDQTVNDEPITATIEKALKKRKLKVTPEQVSAITSTIKRILTRRINAANGKPQDASLDYDALSFEDKGRWFFATTGSLCVDNVEQLRLAISSRYLDLDEEAVCRAYLDVKSVYKVAELFKCSTVPICQILKRNDIARDLNLLKLDETAVIDFYKKVHSTVKVAKKFGCSTPTIADILRHHGIARDGVKLSLDENAAITEYRKTKSAVKVGIKFKCSTGAILRLLSRHGISRVGTKLNSAQESKIIDLYKKTNNSLTVAKEFGYSPTTITNVLKRNGVAITGINWFTGKKVQIAHG